MEVKRASIDGCGFLLLLLSTAYLNAFLPLKLKIAMPLSMPKKEVADSLEKCELYLCNRGSFCLVSVSAEVPSRITHAK